MGRERNSKLETGSLARRLQSVLATPTQTKRKNEAIETTESTESTEKKTQRRVPAGSSAPPGTRPSAAMVSERNDLQERALVARTSLRPSTLSVLPGYVACRFQWTSSTSVWFAQVGKARVLNAYISMGRPASKARCRHSADPVKRVGERRERPGLPSVFLCALCVSVVNLCFQTRAIACRYLGSNPETQGISGAAPLSTTAPKPGIMSGWF